MYCWRIITTTEKILVQSLSFHLLGKKVLHTGDNNFEVIVVNVNEHSVEQPQKKQYHYSGKKKRHTLKSQIIAEQKSGKTLAVHIDNGRKHDFRLFKESCLPILLTIQIQADSGYQGIQRKYTNSKIPIKGKRKQRLQANRKAQINN